MIVYQVFNWDPMASNWGEEYLVGTYLHKRDAEARAIALNEAQRESFMKRCSPGAEGNYHDVARVVPTEVQ